MTCIQVPAWLCRFDRYGDAFTDSDALGWTPLEGPPREVVMRTPRGERRYRFVEWRLDPDGDVVGAWYAWVDRRLTVWTDALTKKGE